MEKSNIITRIIKKFLSGRFSVETEEKVQRWIMKEENAEEKEKASLEYWNELDTEADSKTYSALERVNLRTGYNKEHLENIVLYHKFVRIVAVVIPICLLAGGLLYYIPSENEQIEISTAYGEQKRLVLPDSSEVWLNAGSTITYPKTFTKENRVVTLDGEAYFSVRKDDAKPFIVETSQLSVINGKTNCSTFTKHFVPNLILLTQNKMCILLRWFHLFTSFVYLCISLA